MSNPTTDREASIDQIIADFVLAEQTGCAPSREAWLASHPSLAGELAEFLDDRARFAGAIQPIRIVEMPTGRERLRIEGTGRETAVIAFSPDNRRLAAISHSNSFRSNVKLFELDAGREVLSLPMARGICSAIAFSPDGRRFATATTEATDPWQLLLQPGPNSSQVQIWEAPAKGE